MTRLIRPLTIILAFVLTSLILTGCATDQTESGAANSCPVIQPQWLKAPEDDAVQNSPEYGNYFANEDQSILASAWWTEADAYQ